MNNSARVPDPLFVLRGHRDAVNTVRFLSPTLLVSGDATGVVKQWDLASRRAVATWQVHDKGVLSINCTTAGRIISQGKDGFVKVYTVNSDKPVLQFETKAYSFCRASLLELKSEKALESTQSQDKKQEQQTLNNASSVSSVLATSREVASVITIWDLETGKALQSINCEATSPGSRKQQSVSTEDEEGTAANSGSSSSERKFGMVMCCKLIAGSIAGPNSNNANNTNASNANASVSTGQQSSSASELKLSEETKAPQPKKSGLSLALAKKKAAESATSKPEDGKSNSNSNGPVCPPMLLICGMESGHVGCWDVVTGKLLLMESLHKEPVLALDVLREANDGSKLSGVTGAAGGQITVFSIDLLKGKLTKRSIELKHEGVADVQIRQDTRIFATAGWDHRVRVYNWATLEPLAVLRFHTESVYCLDFATADSTGKLGLLVTGSKDARIAVYDLYPKQVTTSENTTTKPSGSVTGDKANSDKQADSAVPSAP